MRVRIGTLCGALALSAFPLLADFSYRETTQVTGGSLAGILRFASKQLREPIESTVAVKGNKLARRSPMRLTIIDLDGKTITEADLQKKTYSVMTFDEMKQALDRMSKSAKQNNANMQFKVSAEPTGKTKEIAGLNTRELVLRMTMEATDEKTNQTGGMSVVSDLWMAEDVPGYAEVSAFYKKMSAELNWAPGSNLFASQPQISKGMAESLQEIAKRNGAPVLQITAMGPEGMPAPSADEPQAKQTPKPSMGKLLGGALSGRMGGLGRKKSEPPPAEEQPQPGSQPTGAMIEMRMESSGFAPTADPSMFEVPAGFKQVEHEMKRMK